MRLFSCLLRKSACLSFQYFVRHSGRPSSTVTRARSKRRKSSGGLEMWSAGKMSGPDVLRDHRAGSVYWKRFLGGELSSSSGHNHAVGLFNMEHRLRFTLGRWQMTGGR